LLLLALLLLLLPLLLRMAMAAFAALALPVVIGAASSTIDLAKAPKGALALSGLPGCAAAAAARPAAALLSGWPARPPPIRRASASEPVTVADTGPCARWPATVGETNVNYASWTIDSSYNRGFVHISFDNKNLLAAATSLAPSTIRFGGGGNDYLSYQPFSACNSSVDNDNYVCLNTSHWNSLYNWANASGTEFIFGISYDFVAACEQKSAYVWKPDQSIAMVKYIQSQAQTIFAFELGNEVNNRQKSCNTTGGAQAAAFKLFKSDVLDKLYPDPSSRPKLIGPDVVRERFMAAKRRLFGAILC
jgi:hypothetical protein